MARAAVSYTHLDVYKRQVYSNGNASNNSASNAGGVCFGFYI